MKTVKCGLDILMLGTDRYSDPVQVGKLLMLKVWGDGQKALVDERLKTQDRQGAGFENMAGGEVLVIFLVSGGFSNGYLLILIHPGAAGQSDSLYQLLLIQEISFHLGWGVCPGEDLDPALAAFTHSAAFPVHIQICILQGFIDTLPLWNI